MRVREIIIHCTHNLRKNATPLHMALAIGTIGGMFAIIVGLEAIGVATQSIVVIVVAFLEE